MFSSIKLMMNTTFQGLCS